MNERNELATAVDKLQEVLELLNQAMNGEVDAGYRADLRDAGQELYKTYCSLRPLVYTGAPPGPQWFGLA